MSTIEHPRPVVSIITVTYNGMATLPSLLKGTAELLSLFPDIEHVVVDGLSTDDSQAFLLAYSKKFERVTFISEKDAGIYDAMNKGVALCTGRYFIHLNSDDEVVNPDEWGRALQFLRERQPVLLAADVPIVRGDQVTRYIPGKPISILHRYFGHHFPHQGTFFHISLFNEIGGYSTKIGYVADKIFCYQVWDRAPAHQIAFGEQPLAFQRAGGISSRSTLTPLKTIWLVLKAAKITPHRNAYMRALLNPFFKVFMLYKSPRRSEYQRMISNAAA